MNLVRNLHRTHNPSPSRSRRVTTAALALLTVATLGTTGAVASTATANSTAAKTAAAPEKKLVASSVLGSDYKYTLTAVRSSEYAATVELEVYQQKNGAWKETDLVTVGDPGGWYWYPLGGKGAVCEFSTSSHEPAPITVSLLVTPSIGCSVPVHYVVKQGRVYTA
ncbi:hypothetical protein [Streptomyces sp. NBC_01538]|uniref:hypothetical protein n=1 Tax=Streptomyces sp. NBC_01538 TaxID=2903897 RepID=UPI0038698084